MWMGVYFLVGNLVEKEEIMKNSTNVRMLVEAGVMMAIALVLDNIKIFSMPQGGSVTLGSMIPILIFAFRWGFKSGITTGVAFGILQFLLGGRAIHIASILLDYVIAWGALGLAGFFRGSFPKVMLGSVVGIAGRFLCSFTAGIVIYGEYAPEGMNVALYSLIYNGSYMGVEAIIALVVIGVLYKAVGKQIFLS